MKIRADTNNEERVPEIGMKFSVANVQKISAFWIIELEEIK